MGRTPIHPGLLLKDELLELNINANEFAGILNVPANRIYQIIDGRRDITIDTAHRLSKFFGTTVEYWLNLQRIYDLDMFDEFKMDITNNIPTKEEYMAKRV